MLPSTLWSYLAQWLSTTTSTSLPDGQPRADELTFELRHLHAHAGQRVLFADVSPAASLQYPNERYTVRTQRSIVYKPRSLEQLTEARRRSRLQGESMLIPWDPDEVEGPDINSRETLLLLAKMTYNAYVEPTDKDWYDLGDGWSTVSVTYY